MIGAEFWFLARGLRKRGQKTGLAGGGGNQNSGISTFLYKGPL